MAFWNRTHAHPIGIDLGHDAIRMVQVGQSPAGPALLAAARRNLPNPSPSGPARIVAAAPLVRQLLKREGFVGRRAVVALADEVLHVRTIRSVIQPPGAPLGSLLAAPEVRRGFDFDLAEATTRLLDAGPVRQGSRLFQELIVIAAKNDDVDASIEAWREAGIKVASLEIRPCALYRAHNRVAPASIAPGALLEIGGSRSRMLIGNGTSISFLKALSTGSEQLNDAVARKLGITAADAAQLRRRLGGAAVTGGDEGSESVRLAVFDATRAPLEALAGEVAACLRYHMVTFRTAPPTRLTLCGTDSSDAQVRAALAAAVSIPVEPMDPLQGIDTAAMKPADRQSPPGEWAGAVGLAIQTLATQALEPPSTQALAA